MYSKLHKTVKNNKNYDLLKVFGAIRVKPTLNSSSTHRNTQPKLGLFKNTDFSDAGIFNGFQNLLKIWKLQISIQKW